MRANYGPNPTPMQASRPGAHGMAIKIQTEIWELSAAKGTDLLVFLAIGDNADLETRTAFPTVAYLAAKCRISERAVQKCISNLKAIGELQVEATFGPTGRQRRNTYTIAPPAFLGRGEHTSPLNLPEPEPQDDDIRGEPQDTPPPNAGTPPRVNDHTPPRVNDHTPPRVNDGAPLINHHMEPPYVTTIGLRGPAAPPKKNGTHHGPTDTQRTWTAYADAYRDRYHVDPVRNAKVNSQIKQLVDRIGKDAPGVAAYYVQHGGAYYVGRGHAIGFLLTDAEKLRTEWATGRQITTTKANESDRRASSRDTMHELAKHYGEHKGSH